MFFCLIKIWNFFGFNSFNRFIFRIGNILNLLNVLKLPNPVPRPQIWETDFNMIFVFKLFKLLKLLKLLGKDVKA